MVSISLQFSNYKVSQNKPKGLKVAKEELRSIGSLLICIMAEGGEGVMVADRHNGI